MNRDCSNHQICNHILDHCLGGRGVCCRPRKKANTECLGRERRLGVWGGRVWRGASSGLRSRWMGQSRGEGSGRRRGLS